MATATVCDVYGTARGVREYRVAIEQFVVDAEKPGGGSWQHDYVSAPADLGPRALERLKKKINASLTEPSRRARKAAASASDQQQ